jgi:hypothetical protein
LERGWIKLYRKIQDNPSWTAEPFTHSQAWVDLLLLANHKDGHILVRGNKVPVLRGQVGWSVLSLSRRWKWSRGKVNRFLDELETEQQIVQQKNRVTSVITIINYDSYQGNGQQTEQQTDNRQATDGQQTDTNNNNKNEKNGKKKDIKTSPDALRLSGFLADKVLENLPTYSKLVPSKRETTIQRWAVDIDRLNRINGKSWEEIETVIEWCQRDSFWSSNILSGKKLRDKFDQLQLNMRNPQQGKKYI